MRKRIFLSTFALVLITTTLAWAQGYLNPPVYATGAIYVQSGGTVSTTVHQAANPANINVYAVGDITSWTVNMPFPAFDGQLISIGCLGGAVGTITVVATSPDTVAAGGPAACVTASGIAATYQYSGIYQQWMLNSFPVNKTGDTFTGDVNLSSGLSYNINGTSVLQQTGVKSWLPYGGLFSGGLSGTSSAADSNVYLFNTTSTIKDTAAENIAVKMNHAINAGASGAQTGLSLFTTFNGASDALNPARFYTSAFPHMDVYSADGGTGTSLANSKGNFYAMGAISTAHSGATNLQGRGSEIDVMAMTASSVAVKSALSLVSGGDGSGNDKIQGAVHDSLLALTSDSASNVGVKVGISIGREDSYWPIEATTGRLIYAANPVAFLPGALHGIDFSNVTFTGCAIKTFQFCVDGTGNLLGGSIAASGANGGLVANSRTGSGENLQWYNASGTGLALFNGTRDIATFDVSNNGSLSIVGQISAPSLLLTPTTVAALGTCNSGAKGTLKAVSDGTGALAWGATVTGGASTYYTVNCNGSAWTVMGK